MAGKTAYKNQYAAEKYDRISLMLPKGGKVPLKAAATEKANGSINQYCIQAINKQLAADGFPTMQRQENIEPAPPEQTAEPIQNHPEQHAENQMEQEETT